MVGHLFTTRKPLTTGRHCLTLSSISVKYKMGSNLIYHFDAICTTFNVFPHLKKPNFLEQFVLYMLNDRNNIKIATKVIVEIRNM